MDRRRSHDLAPIARIGRLCQRIQVGKRDTAPRRAENGEPRKPIGRLQEWIEVVGAEQTTFGSDVGQATSPSPADVFQRVTQLLIDRALAAYRGNKGDG